MSTWNLIDNSRRWNKAAASYYSVIAIDSSGQLWGIGKNFHNLINHTAPTSQDFLSLTQIGTRNDWRDVSVGAITAMALDDTGRIWARGNNSNGELGVGPSSFNDWTQIGSQSGWTAISTSGSHSYALRPAE